MIPHMKRAGFRAILALTLLALDVGIATATDATVDDTFDKKHVAAEIQPLISDGSYVGIIVGIVEPHERRIFSFGSTDRNENRKPSGETVFALASITKTFTGALLADLTLRGIVRLDDSIAKFLPPGVIKPGSRLNRITLLDLATHTSGLPRMATNAGASPTPSRRPPYSVRQMYAFLSDYQPHQKPGTKFLYSNIGIALLGHLLERASGIPYEQLVEQRICRPLKMASTRVTLNASMRRRLAQGYDRRLRPVELRPFDVGKSSGGLYSTANDMMKYLAANMGLSDAPIVPALLEAQRPFRQVPGKETAFMGLTWHVNRTGIQITSKNGGLAGYQSFIAFSKAHQIGIIALANTSLKGRKLDAAARRILLKMLSQPDQDAPALDWPERFNNHL
jgi:D-alanyl-D-alanine-carboxypeptidase/D-alanyl-D-alanine-endopeptidase